MTDERQWAEEGIGSAEYFGQCLIIVREQIHKQNDLEVWAATGGLDISRYSRLEHGQELKPELKELDSWLRGWNLTREEIVALKMAGSYDISYYLGDQTSEDAARELEWILEESRRKPWIEKVIAYWIGMSTKT